MRSRRWGVAGWELKIGVRIFFEKSSYFVQEGQDELQKIRNAPKGAFSIRVEYHKSVSDEKYMGEMEIHFPRCPFSCRSYYKECSACVCGSPLRPIEHADAASFHVFLTIEGVPFGRDRSAIYYAFLKDPYTIRRLTVSDPRSFQIKTVPTIEPALRSVTYGKSNLLVYAHDEE